jgi:hypothetical protein
MNPSARVMETRFGTYGTIIAALYVAILLIGFWNGLWLVRPSGSPKLMDFMPLWAAGHEAAIGSSGLAYDPASLRQLQLSTAGLAASDAHFDFNYPPHFLFVLAPLGALPYVPAAFVWIAVQVCIFLAVVYLVAQRRSAIGIAAAMPLTLWAAYTVQSGFLAAGLIGSSLYFMERRPLLAGFLLGLLSYKPHLGILFPVVLICAGRWRIFASAAITVLGLVVLSALVFGLEAWSGFGRAVTQAGDVYLAAGGPWGFAVIQSVYGLARWLGAGPALAWTCHGVIATCVATLICALWRQEALSYNLKAAALSLGVLAVTPYLYAYDLVILAISAAFLAREMTVTGILRGELAILIALYFGSVLLLPFLVWVPFAPLAIGALMALLLRRASLSTGWSGPVFAQETSRRLGS